MPAKTVQVAIAGMRADRNAARFRQLDRPPHDVGVAGMEAAGHVDRARELDHGGVVAHLPRAKTFAEVAIEIDRLHGCSPPLVLSFTARPSPARSRHPSH